MIFKLDTFGDEPFVKEVEPVVYVTVSENQFSKGIISKIQISKFDNGKCKSFIVDLYIGHINIATWIPQKDIVFDEDISKSGILVQYRIRNPYTGEEV